MISGYVTLRRDNPLAIQLRFTFTPVLRIGGVVMSVIRGKSAMARNKFMAREWINFQLFTTRIILLVKPTDSHCHLEALSIQPKIPEIFVRNGK